MTKEMRMHGLCDPCLLPVLFDELLDTPWRKWSVSHRLEEIAIFRIGP